MKVFVTLSMLLAVAFAAPGVIDNQVNSGNNGLTGVFGNCIESGDITTCLAVKGITALNRAARSANIELIPGLQFVRNPSSNVRAGKSLSENEIVDSLPADSTEKNGRLWDMALESASNFMGTHNLQFKLPAETTVNMARAIEEGRGKLKKIAGPLMLAVGAKLLALVPIFLGGLALLAVKALVVAKIAFVLAAVLGFQKFAGGSGGGLNFLSKASGAGQQSYGAPAGGSAQGWSSGNGVASAQYPYARSYDAQDLAYSAQAPSTQ